MEDFKVGTYNGAHWKPDNVIVNDVKKLISNTGISLLGLQEMGSSNRRNELAKIAKWNIWFQGGAATQGAPIMWDSRVWQLVTRGTHKLHGVVPPHSGGVGFTNQGKWATWVQFRRNSDGVTVTFVNIHMIPSIYVNARGIAYKTGIASLANWARNKDRVIIVGDFNSTVDHAYNKPLRNVGLKNAFDYHTRSGGTHGGRKIDHIWTFPKHLSASTLQILGGYNSDHKPVVATINDKQPTTIAKPPAGTGNAGVPSNGSPLPAPEPLPELNQDISGLPFEFNPPLHSANLHYAVQFDDPDRHEASMKEYLREPGKSKALSDYTKFRLGRIQMGDEAVNFEVTGDKRWGFRFLFNPSQVSGGSDYNHEIVPDVKQQVPLILQVGLEVVTFTLLLDRVPDVMGESTTAANYSPTIDGTALTELKRRGTNYDLEYLYRVSNVRPVQTKDEEYTADIGILLPNICVLTLGGVQYRGRLQAITAQHILFSPSMVPIRTQVGISFQRVVSMSEEDLITASEGAGYDIQGRIAGKNEEEFGDGVLGRPDRERQWLLGDRRWHIIVCGLRREGALPEADRDAVLAERLLRKRVPHHGCHRHGGVWGQCRGAQQQREHRRQLLRPVADQHVGLHGACSSQGVRHLPQ